MHSRLLGLFITCLLGGFLLIVAGCGGPKEYLVASDLVIGADAHIVAKALEDQAQTLLTVTATHLAPPSRVADGALYFVVWYRQDAESMWSRVGILTYNEDQAVGTLAESTVPAMAFDLVITAEPALDVTLPAGALVFSQAVTSN